MVKIKYPISVAANKTVVTTTDNYNYLKTLNKIPRKTIRIMIKMIMSLKNEKVIKDLFEESIPNVSYNKRIKINIEDYNSILTIAHGQETIGGIIYRMIKVYKYCLKVDKYKIFTKE
jgi:hypothetical protein